MKNDEKVISALEDMKRRIEEEGWTIFANDSGSGSAGVRQVDNSDVIGDYLNFAKTGDNENIPNTYDIYYIPVEDFDEDDNEVVDEILDCYGQYVTREEVLGFVVCHEHYDMDYTFYMLHIEDA